MISTHQREKRMIQKREQILLFFFSVLPVIAFFVTGTISPRIAPIDCLPFFLMLIVGIAILGPLLQKTQRQKQHWFNEYGLHVLASVTKRPEENALVLGRSRRRHRRHVSVYLNWQDPQTGQLYSFYVSTRFYFSLWNLPEGSFHPIQFDPSDPSFFLVSTRNEEKDS